MPKGQVTVRIDARPLHALVRAMPGRTKAVVKRNAEKIRDRAMLRAHVLTGAMRASVYINMGTGDSTYSSAAAQAAQLNPKAVIEPEVPTTRQRAGAVVGVAVNYGVYEEARAGHAFLLPAALSVQPAFFDDARTIVEVP